MKEQLAGDRLASKLLTIVVLVLTIVGILLTINKYFYLEFFMGITMIENRLLIHYAGQSTSAR